MRSFAALIVATGASAVAIPLPTAAQLAYQQQEIVALTHFNMATFYQDGDPACTAANWGTSQKPASFAPTALNISNWIENYKVVGAKSGILTAKHGCGFLLWPTNVTFPDGTPYGYHVGGSGGIGRDIVGEFAEAMGAAGLPHSFYFSLKDSFLMNAVHDKVRDPSTLIPGQRAVTQAQFEAVHVAAVTELWSRYGNLTEIWFDGGISDSIKGRIVPLLRRLQPDAVPMGAGIENSANEVDWVGTETGEPAYPVWSTGCTAPGAGSRGVSPAKATNFCPKCGDCTLQSPDHWFWMPNTPIKPLAQLVAMYHGTVGQNAVMELDFAVDRTGNIDPTHAARYAEFGGWIDACYGDANAAARSGPAFANASQLVLPLGKAPVAVDRVAVSEDLAHGQRILAYTVEVQTAGSSAWAPFVAGTAVGHKHINIAPTATAAATALRLTVTSSVAPPLIRLDAFGPAACAAGPAPGHKCSDRADQVYTGPVVERHKPGTGFNTEALCCARCGALKGCAVFNLHADKTCELLSATQSSMAEAGAVSGSWE